MRVVVKAAIRYSAFLLNSRLACSTENRIMELACLDLEGVLVPEIWIGFAEKTGIEALRATTREVPDYDELMQQRLRILDEHNLKLQDIQEVIATMAPLPGALQFVQWLKSNFQLIILSDTFTSSPIRLWRSWNSQRCSAIALLAMKAAALWIIS